MKIGEFIYAKTHAEFLNELLGTHYKAWMKSSLMLPDGRRLWMIELGDFVSPSGWINRLDGTHRLQEKHVENGFTYEAHNTYKGSILKGNAGASQDRIVFDICKIGGTRKYIFRGVFRINKAESSLNENVWDLIWDEYTF